MAVSEVGECQVKFTQTFFKSLNDIMASAEENSREEAEDWIKALWPLDSQNMGELPANNCDKTHIDKCLKCSWSLDLSFFDQLFMLPFTFRSKVH